MFNSINQGKVDVREWVELIKKAKEQGLSKQEVKDFINNAKGKIDFFIWAEMRKQAIMNNLGTEDQFIEAFSHNPIKALEELFVQQVRGVHVKLLRKRIDQGKLTLKGLYQGHCSEPEYMLQRYVL